LSEPRSGADRTDRLLSVCAVIVAVSSVAVAVYQTRIMREQQKASAWPHVAQWNSLPRGGSYTRTVENSGIGPALVGAFQVRVDGIPRHDWGSVVRALTGTTGDGGLVYSSLGQGTVLLPGTSRAVLTLPPGPLATGFWQQAQTRLDTRVCYCSVYGDCWIAVDSVKARAPRPVRACVADSSADFRQE
jgi:hypothetical protein